MPVPPDTPSGFRASPGGQNGMGVEWHGVIGADGYLVEWRPDGGSHGPDGRERVGGGESTGHAVHDLQVGTDYLVRVSALREGAPNGRPTHEVRVFIGGVVATPGRNSLRLAWAPPRELPGGPLVGYTLEWGPAADPDPWDETRRIRLGKGTTRYELPGLDDGVMYRVRVTWSETPDGESEPVGETRGVPSGAAGVSPPVLSTASVQGGAVTLAYDGTLNPRGVPPKSAFAVRGADGLLDVVDVTVDGSDVRLELAEAVSWDETVTAGYTPPVAAGGRIRSAAGQAAAFSNRAVENRTVPPLPVLSVADAEAAEGESLSFAVTLSRAASGPVTVDWTTADGTATAGADYEGATGALTFAAGETEKTVTVAALADTDTEETETLTLTLSNPSGALLGDAEAAGSITDVAPAQQQAFEEPVTSNSRDDRPPGSVPVPVTAAFEDAPSEHGGKGKAFALRVAFSAPVTVGAAKAVREGTVSVGNGEVVRSTRVGGRKDLWQLKVRPGSHGDVTVTLAAAADCAAAGAICTQEGGRLETGLSLSVQGPPALSVSDARGREGRDAALGFAVTLSRAPSGPVTVDYATRDGTATAGEDYTATSGTLAFAAGETEKTVSVAILDDAHDEGRERFTLRLSKAQGAWIEDGKGVGTIRNDDALQRLWLSRFGRTVASQTVAALEGRFAVQADAPSHVTVAGVDLLRAGGDDAALGETLTGLAQAFGAPSAPAADDSPFARPGRSGLWDEPAGASAPARGMTARGLLAGSSFRFATGGALDPGGAMAGWGKVVSGGSGGSSLAGLSYASETATGILGMDWERRGLLVGVALSRSLETGRAQEASGTRYDIEGELSMVAPYMQVRTGERLSFWSALGSGEGSMALSWGDTSQKADISMQLAAAGGRAELLRPEAGGGFALALKGDAFFVRTESARVSTPGVGNLAPATGDASRVRAVLEGSRSFALSGGGSLEPSLSLGLRHDGGDAETGTGVEAGMGLAWSDPARGLTSDLRLYGLAAHESGGYGEWGASGSLRLVPDPSGRGLSLSMTPSWGAQGQTGRLWDTAPKSFAAAGGGEQPGGRLDTEVGYGLSARGGTGTPYAGLGLGDGGARDWRLGWRFTSERLHALSLGIEAVRREAANDNGAEHGVTVRGGIRW